MSEFKIRKGVKLLEIQGAFLLVSDEEARKNCKYVQEVNDTGAIIWKLLEDGYGTHDILKYMLDTYDIDSKNELEKDIKGYIKILQDNNYLQSGVDIEEK